MKIKPVLGLVTGLVFLASVFPSEALGPFVDMGSYDWAQKAVSTMHEKKILTGTGHNRFSPEKIVRRGDFMIILANVFRLSGAYNGSYVDVSSESYYAQAIGLSKDNQFIDQEEYFYPQKPMSRQDMFSIVAKACVKRGIITLPADETLLNQFADERDIAPYAREGIALLVGNKIISGYSGQVYPRQNVSRAEAAVLLNQINSYVEAKEGIFSPENTDAQIYRLNIISMYDNGPSRATGFFQPKAEVRLKNGRYIATIYLKRDARDVEGFKISYNLGKEFVLPKNLPEEDQVGFQFHINNFDVPIYGSIYLASQSTTIKFRIILSR